MLDYCKKSSIPFLKEEENFAKIMLEKTPGCMTIYAVSAEIIDNLRKWLKNIYYNYILTTKNLMKIEQLSEDFQPTGDVSVDKLSLSVTLFVETVKRSKGRIFYFKEYNVKYKTRVNEFLQYYQDYFMNHVKTLIYLSKMANTSGVQSIICNFQSYVNDFLKIQQALQ